MSVLRIFLSALAVPVGAGGALAAGVGPAPVACEIRVSDTALGRQVEPVALAAGAVAASYAFTVTRVSKGGTAMSSQSGDFETVPGVPTILGTAVFDRKGSIAAELTVRWSGGAVSCTRRFPGA